MSKIAVSGGGAAGMIAAVLRLETEMKCLCMRRTRNLAKNFLLREKGAAI